MFEDYATLLVILEGHYVQKNEWRLQKGLIEKHEVLPLRGAADIAADANELPDVMSRHVAHINPQLT